MKNVIAFFFWEKGLAVGYKNVGELERRLFAAKYNLAAGKIHHDEMKNNIRIIVVVFHDEPNEEYYIAANLRTGDIYKASLRVMCKGDPKKIAIWNTEVRKGKRLLHLKGVTLT
jgi:hypothetical protein